MTCPKCGAYSPYNTSVCNRCGSKLSADGSAKSSARTAARRQYYRNARPSEWEKKRDDLITKANDAVDGMMADSKKRIILLAAAAAAALVILCSAAGCVSCMCGGCAAGEPSPTDTDGGASQTDIQQMLPPLEPVSGADSPSDTDVPSGTDGVSGADVPSPSDTEKVIIAC